MIAATMFLFVLACAIGFAQQWQSRQRHQGVMHTFPVDPLFMFLVGMFVPMLALLTKGGRKLAQEEFRRRRTWIDRGLTWFFIVFWLAEMLTYFDVMPPPFGLPGTGNNYMWNGYLDLIPFIGQVFHWDEPTYYKWWSFPFISAMLLLQYFALRAGMVIGYMNAYMGNMENWSQPKKK